MNLEKISKTTELTMTSRELAELTGKRHADVMRDIRVIEENIGERIFALSSYTSEQGKELPMYTLTKKQCLLVVSKYNDALRLAIIDRWEELERGKMPTNYLDALKALVASEEAKLLAEDSVRRLTHDSKTYTSSEIAKELNMTSAKALNTELSIMGVQYKVNGTWVLYSKYSDKGYESVKQQILDSGHIIYDRKWTGKGRDFILNLMKK